MRSIPLGSVMTSHPISLHCEEMADKVDEIFSNHHIHHLPIVDEAGKLVGIVSQTDFERLKHGATFFKVPDRESYNQTVFRMTRVADIMTKNVVQLSSTDSIQDAYEVFKKNDFRAIPIVDNGELKGIISPLDLLAHFLENKSKN